MAYEHIQRTALRKLLQRVKDINTSVEDATDQIINIINDNYDLKQEKIPDVDHHEFESDLH